jgi:hypothetical protein
LAAATACGIRGVKLSLGLGVQTTEFLLRHRSLSRGERVRVKEAAETYLMYHYEGFLTQG